MKLPEDAYLLRIFIGESDRHLNKPLYEQLVLKARELNLAGATVVRGVMGYGAASRIHTAKLLELSTDLPIVVEVVDTEENLDRLMPFIDQTVTEGLVTLEKVRVIKYRHKDHQAAGTAG
jgi:PII-like signaling protein